MNEKKISYNDKKFNRTTTPVIASRSQRNLVVRFKSKKPEYSNDYFLKFNAQVVYKIDSANVFVLSIDDKDNINDVKDEIRKNADVTFAGNAFIINDEPVVYTGNIIIIFNDDKNESDCLAFFNYHDLVVKQQLVDIGNTWMVSPKQQIGSSVIDLGYQLLSNPDVEASYPEIVKFMPLKMIHPNQWHLKPTRITYQADINASANVEEAHKITRGEGVVVAVIDDAIDITHPEFSSLNKTVHPANFAGKVMDANPMPKNSGETHGTACAGVAVASGLMGASGVAPGAKLMAIRHPDFGSLNEAKAFLWAAMKGADIISCSWGPEDGNPLNSNDPLHNQVSQMPPHTQRAIEYAATKGRNGKGCAIFFASGNGNESVDNDGYASHPNVMAVAACNSESLSSYYSDFGKAVFCAFPSDDLLANIAPGIWTTSITDKSAGNNGSINTGDVYGNYINNFGGTSSACPGAAGVAALLLSIKPELTLTDLKYIMMNTCDKIEKLKKEGEKSEYDKNGHSLNYGYGRLNAEKAVRMAMSFKSSSVN